MELTPLVDRNSGRANAATWKRRFAALAAAAVVAWPGANANATRGAAVGPPPEPFLLYGPEIRFDVVRNGKVVGAHRVQFKRNGDEIVAESDFSLRINVLFLTAYRFEYRSEGRWRDGHLVALTAAVDDNGDRAALNAVRNGDTVAVEASGARYAVAAPLFPTTHWNPEVLIQPRVLNTLTGKINEVRVVPKAREFVPTERGETLATRYAYTGDLETEVWYDDNGRWVKMRFAGRDGSVIDYVCRRCQGPEAGQTAR